MKYWTESWSLIEGCSPVSPACENCWLMNIEKRFHLEYSNLLSEDYKNGKPRLHWSGDIIVREDRLDIPLKTKKPTVFAVWSDLFHPLVSADFIIEAFERMSVCNGQEILTKDGKKTYLKHTFLVLTKRPEGINSVLYGQEGNFYLGGGDYIPNVWLGTTVENQEMADKRIPELLRCSPFKLFLSIEPMLEKINISNICIDASTEYNRGDIKSISDISYIIAGCESGPHARETKIEWVEDLRRQCISAGIPLWVKQLKENGKMVYNHPLSTIDVRDLWK